MDGPPRNRILIVAAKDVVITVRQIQPADVSIAVHADVPTFDSVRSYIANQRGPHQKTVAIEFAAAAIVVVKRAGLNRVALFDEVLPKNVRDVNVLMPPIKTIQTAVRVFLELRKIRRVVLITIIIK